MHWYMEIIDTWRLIKCLNHLLLGCWLPQTYVRAFPVWTALFFQKRLIIDRAESHRGIHAYGNRSFCLDFFFVWTPMLIILMDQFDWITAFAIVLCYVVLNIVLFWSTKHAIAVSYFQEKGRKESYSES